jgi:hypothetical protein
MSITFCNSVDELSLGKTKNDTGSKQTVSIDDIKAANNMMV